MQIQNVRFIIAAITTFSAYAVYVSRVNLSIAIIAMVDDNHNHGSTTQTDISIKQQTLQTAPTTANLLPSKSDVDDDFDAPNRLNETLINPSEQQSNSRVARSERHQRQRRSTAAGANVNINYDPDQQAKSTRRLSPGNESATFDKAHPPPMSAKTYLRMPMITQQKFDWDQTEQGHILGAFFYGYILFQIPGARMAESVGAKWIILVANAGSAFISLIFPLSTQLNSIQLLMVLRFVMGLCQSAFFPAAYVLFCRWLPERERSILLPIMFIGSNMGSISTYIMSSYLISATQGWPSVFYLSGLICLLVTLLWCIVGSNGPNDNWLISEKERNFILTNVNTNQNSEARQKILLSDGDVNAAHSKTGKNGSFMIELSGKPIEPSKQETSRSSGVDDLLAVRKKKLSTVSCDAIKSSSRQQQKAPNKQSGEPLTTTTTTTTTAATTGELVREPPSWRKLLRSVPIWTLILSMYGNEWSQVVLCYELPTYLNTALGFPIEQNGVINSFFQLSYTVASPIMSSLGAYMLNNQVFGMRKIHVRKLFQSLATFGQLACFLSFPLCGANRGLIIMFMFSAIVFKSCANAGDIMVSSDLSPEYAGTIFAFANSCGNTAGFFVPLLAGAFVSDAYQREQWTPFWLTSATIMGTSGLIFLIFGDTNRQDFSSNKPQTQTQAEDAIKSPDRGSASTANPRPAH